MLPVPLSFAGKSSGEMAYKTPYMIYNPPLSNNQEVSFVTYVTIECIRTIPPQQRVRAAGGGACEQKGTCEPYLSRGVVE